MALAPTLYDFNVALSHVDRSLDVQLSVRTARHPSETLERLWIRVLAYCFLYEERLAFGPGLGDPDAPDLELKDLTGRITRWIRVGKPDPAKIQRAVDQNPDAQVTVVLESPARMEAFIAEAKGLGLTRIGRAELLAFDPELVATLARTDQRRPKLTLTLVGDHAYVDREGQTCDGPVTRGRVE